MQNLKIDDGLKEFTINGDKSRVIRFNPSDINLLDRLDQAEKTITEAQDKLEEDIKLDANGEPERREDIEFIRKVNKLIKEQTDFIFDAEVSDVVFGNQSPMSSVKGRPFFERFFDVIKPVLEKEITKEREASAKRMSKYTDQVK